MTTRDGIAIVMMMTLGIIRALCADEKAKWPGTVGKTGKQLPVWVVAGVKALSKEVPSGYTVNDIIFIDKYRDLKPVLSPALYEFVAYRHVPAYLAGEQVPRMKIPVSRPQTERVENRRCLRQQMRMGLRPGILYFGAMCVLAG